MFENYYEHLIQSFNHQGLLTTVTCQNGRIIWPNASGVYVIWNTGENELLYVGLTGKFHRDGNQNLVFNNGTFSHRAQRWTPYRFSQDERDGNFQYHFRYGPISPNNQTQYEIRFNADAYLYSIPFTSIEIHCFHVNENHETYSPSLLEAEILTKYLKSNGNLPPANNTL